MNKFIVIVEVVLASPVTVLPAFISVNIVLMTWEASVGIDMYIKNIGTRLLCVEDRG